MAEAENQNNEKGLEIDLSAERLLIVSDAMEHSIPDIDHLSQMPDGSMLAFKFAMRLVPIIFEMIKNPEELKCFAIPPIYHPPLRSCDSQIKALVKLLLRSASRVKRQDNTFFPKDEYDIIKKQTKELEGICQWFPAFRRLCWLWGRDLQYVRDQARLVEDDIRSMYKSIRNIEKEDQNGYLDHSFSSEEDTEDLFLSKKLMNLLPLIEDVGNMGSAGLHLALDLVMFFGRHTYTENPHQGSSNEYRPSDSKADDLFVELAKLIKEEDPGFAPLAIFQALRYERDFLATANIDSYFPKAMTLLATWMPKAATSCAEEQYNEVLKKVKTEYRKVRIVLNQYTADKKKPRFHILGHRLKPTLSDIRNLGKFPRGLPYAINLVLDLGSFSYPDAGGPQYGWQVKEHKIRRVMDADADALLLGLIRRARKEEEYYNFKSLIIRIQNGMKEMNGGHTFSPKSYDLACSLCN